MPGTRQQTAMLRPATKNAICWKLKECARHGELRPRDACTSYNVCSSILVWCNLSVRMCRERYTHHWVLKIQKRALRSLDHRQVCYSDEYELNRAIIIQITVLFAKKPRFSDLIITAVIDAINEALVDRLVTALSERNPSFVCDDDKKWLWSEKLDVLAGPFEAETTAKAYIYTERESGVR